MPCVRRELAEVTADPLSALWQGCPAHPLRSVLDGAPPRQGTIVKSAWSADEWRILFEVADTDVRATLTERGAPLYEEEVVELFVDPIGDLECYFEIEVNPLNAVLEVVLRRNRSGYTKDFAWRCDDLRTAVRRHEAGWSAELAIPFRNLTAEAPRVGTLWRANFCRIDRPPGVERELTAWSPPGRASFHTPDRFGILEFTE
jgi:hypothetical protein